MSLAAADRPVNVFARLLRGPAREAHRAPMTGAVWPRYALAVAVAVTVPPLLGRAGVLDDSRALTLGIAVCFAVGGISLNIMTGYAGQLSLGHFALLGIGAYVSSKLTTPTLSDPVGAPFIVGVIGAVIAGAALAFLIGLPALRLRGLYLAVVTIVFNFLMVESVFQSSWFASGSGGVTLPKPIVGGFEFLRNADYLAVLLCLLILVWLLDANLTSSRLGRAFHAIRSDDKMAASFGVQVTRNKLIAFTVSGAVAGMAGAMYGHLVGTVSSDTFRYDQSLVLLTFVVLGGLGSRGGVTLAAAFYGVANQIVGDTFGADKTGWIIVVSALALMYTVSRHPNGFAGAWREARDRRRAGSVHGDVDAVPRLPDLPRPTGLPARAAVPDGVPLVRASEITVDFGGLRAVDDASLEVHRNKIVGLIGPNGAGKTTLFNVISGALRPTRGRVELLGRDMTAAPAHVRAAAGLGRTFQLIGLAKDRTVTENLLLAQHQVARYSAAEALLGVGRAPKVEAELRQRAWDALVALGFERYADTPVAKLSHGQQRIVEIGCALITAPEVVMLDEPSAGMAPGAVENLAVRLRDMRDELGRTVLLIEHNIPLVLDVCDELYVLDSGRVIAHGDPQDVVQEPAVITAYLGEAVA
jgi:ABC-type branched-subunit amino acid transport system ATPase component/ABC-type branched-subunit amino acid transport system permease subunit